MISNQQDVVIFKSDLFNLTEPKDYFINPCCFGDDLANWLIEKLRAKGIEVDAEAGQEDFGWYINYVVDGIACCAVIGNVEEESWFVIIERQCGLITSMLGRRHKNIPQAAIDAVRIVLGEEARITEVRWTGWQEFKEGRLP